MTLPQRIDQSERTKEEIARIVVTSAQPHVRA